MLDKRYEGEIQILVFKENKKFVFNKCYYMFIIVIKQQCCVRVNLYCFIRIKCVYVFLVLFSGFILV